MEWSSAAIDAWTAIRSAPSSDEGAVGIGDVLLRLADDTLPSSALRAALQDRAVWASPENLRWGRVLRTATGFMLADFPTSAEEAAGRERARRVGERHIAMALAARGQTAFDAFQVRVDKLVERVRRLELGPGFLPSEIAGRWHGLIDTSIAIQYQDLHNIDWLVETGQSPVTIWISSVLLDELDDMKFNSRNRRVKRRAEVFSRWVRPLLPHAVMAQGAPVPGRPGVLLRAWAPGLELRVPDSRHLEAAFALLDRQVPVHLISGDNGQVLRALAHGVEVFDLDEKWLLPESPQDEV